MPCAHGHYSASLADGLRSAWAADAAGGHAARYTARGLPTRADEVMVVNGAVSGLALVLRMMTGPGDRVVVDHPTYPLAIAAIQGAQCRPVGVSLPETGWDTDASRQRLPRRRRAWPT